MKAATGLSENGASKRRAIILMLAKLFRRLLARPRPA
jgi:hypothetical protein